MSNNPYNIPFTQSPAEPSLMDVLNLFKQQILLALNCHAIATIQSFNAAAQTVTATVNYQKTFFEMNSRTKNYDPVLVDYPLIVDCPAVIMGGGTKALTFPIAKGDQCIILFNDRDMDKWFSGARSGPPASGRLHAFADAIALVGIRSKANPLDGYDTARAVLKDFDGGSMVGVGGSKVKVSNNDTTLNTLLQSLISAINDLVSATAAITVTNVSPGLGTSGPPANAGAISAVASTLSDIASDIGGLLE